MPGERRRRQRWCWWCTVNGNRELAGDGNENGYAAGRPMSSQGRPISAAIESMRAIGIEPTRVLPHQNLNLARLPISPRPRQTIPALAISRRFPRTPTKSPGVTPKAGQGLRSDHSPDDLNRLKPMPASRRPRVLRGQVGGSLDPVDLIFPHPNPPLPRPGQISRQPPPLASAEPPQAFLTIQKSPLQSLLAWPP